MMDKFGAVTSWAMVALLHVVEPCVATKLDEKQFCIDPYRCCVGAVDFIELLPCYTAH
jgi:hypothetical protein